MGSVKYTTGVEEYADCFVEIEDRWTMREVKALVASDGPEYFEFFKTKVVAMRLRDVNGVEYTNPKTFSEDDMLDFDMTMVGFVGSVLSIHAVKRKQLGGLSVRPSSGGSATEAQAQKS